MVPHNGPIGGPVFTTLGSAAGRSSQRGAAPTTQDRILASAFGVYAVDLLAQKKFDRMVAWMDRKVVDFPIEKGIKTYKKVEKLSPIPDFY